MSKDLSKFIYDSVYVYRTPTISKILEQCRRNRYETTRAEVAKIVEEVCTPYKRDSNG